MLKAIAVVEQWALAVWVGSLVGFAFVFAPIAFSRLSDDLDAFSSIVSRVFGVLATLGYVCGGIVIVTSLLHAFLAAQGGGSWRLALLRACCVIVMLGLVTFSQAKITPAMEQVQASFHAPFNSIPKDDPRRVRYDRLHAQSSRVYGTVLLLGLIAIAFSAWEPRP
jgi:hypothetical protein